ncbi:MAG: metal-dependent hydrolase, partial [Mariprofundaceae bacterium]
MDPLTHALTGAALARAARPRFRRATLWLVLLSLAPDADFALRLVSDTFYLEHHRGVTHSVLMLPLWVWLLHALLRRPTGGLPAWMIAAALALHILLDAVTAFGTMILAPVSDWRAALDWVFIIDPLLTAGLALPLALLLLLKDARWPAWLALGWLAAWLGFCAAAHHKALAVARAAFPQAESVAALPLPFSPMHWQLIASFPDRYARAGIDLHPAFAGSEPLFP